MHPSPDLPPEVIDQARRRAAMHRAWRWLRRQVRALHQRGQTRPCGTRELVPCPR